MREVKMQSAGDRSRTRLTRQSPCPASARAAMPRRSDRVVLLTPNVCILTSAF